MTRRRLRAWRRRLACMVYGHRWELSPFMVLGWRGRNDVCHRCHALREHKEG